MTELGRLRRGRPAFAAALAATLATAVLVVGCVSSGDEAAAPPSSDPVAATSTANPASSTSTSTSTSPNDGCEEVEAVEPVEPQESASVTEDTPAGAEVLGTYAVGRQSRTFVDSGRGTDADEVRGLAASPTRTLAVTVLYPSDGPPAAPGEFVQDASPAPGRFPLVVYSHGVLSSGTERNDTLARWASAGYVVIAPTFPLSSGPGARIHDLVNQPADVVFVTESFAAAVRDGNDSLHGLAATGCLALAGHSLGGATTLATAFDPCCGQLAVRAVVDIAGVLIHVTPGAQLADSPPVPTLIVHGDQDPLVPHEQGQRAFEELTGPRWFLSLEGGDHNSMFVAPRSDALDASVLALLDAELKGDATHLEQLAATVERTDGATLEVSP